jgi:tRNA G18 (ribose-2'-O)-methylase SpoU
MPRIKVTGECSVILHNVRSILNVGSIFRTADAAGWSKVWLTGYTPGPDTEPDRIHKTALGAEHSVAWGRVKRVGDLLRRLRRNGARIVVLERADESTDYRAYRPHYPLALVVGNEVEGTKDVTSHNLHDAVVGIPMRGTKESLNVAVAFGVIAYELTRARTP